jgi:hypothetical protein
MSCFPGISQLKSIVQALTGDLDGAKQTQTDFLESFPVASQLTSLYYSIKGEESEAVRVQKRCLDFLSQTANSVPIVGHVKAGIHKVCGDDKGASEAFKASTRTTAVIAGAAGGFCLGGPPGAIAGGMAGGIGADSTISVVQQSPYGVVENAFNATEHAVNGEYNKIAGEVFEFALGVAGDGLLGKAVGQKMAKTKAKNAVKNVPLDEMKEHANLATEHAQLCERMKEMREQKASLERRSHDLTKKIESPHTLNADKQKFANERRAIADTIK